MTSKVVVVCLAWLAIAPASACKKSSPEGEADGVKLGTFTCADVQKDVCIGPTDRFAATVPVVHMTYSTKDLPKNGDEYTVRWIAEDVGASAPANTAIDSITMKVADVVAGTARYTVNSHLTR